MTLKAPAKAAAVAELLFVDVFPPEGGTVPLSALSLRISVTKEFSRAAPLPVLPSATAPIAAPARLSPSSTSKASIDVRPILFKNSCPTSPATSAADAAVALVPAFIALDPNTDIGLTIIFAIVASAIPSATPA